ncbi:hypothetical protein [Sphingobium sp. MK2]|uniref:hypothetical protein n=1 Tax=Sphingobium sp. MK2 TaxID=3116540 RepID=UPI0032E36096
MALIMGDLGDSKLSALARRDPKGWNDRIFEEPNHRHYGPVRRLHIILMQITENYSSIDSLFAADNDMTWDTLLSFHLAQNRSEPEAQRRVISEWLFYADWQEQ